MDFTHSLWLMVFCNIKPFESKIHVCVVLNCTFLLSALGILVFLSFQMTLLCWKPTAEEMLCLYSCFLCSGASSWSPCAGSTISVKLWTRTVCCDLLFPDGLLELEPCSPESSSLHTSDLGHWTVAAGLFWLQDKASVPEWRWNNKDWVCLHRAKENLSVIQWNGERREFNGLLAGALCWEYPGITGCRSLAGRRETPPCIWPAVRISFSNSQIGN